LVSILAVCAPAWAQQPPAPDPTTATWGNGLTFSSGVNSLTIGARAQFRWTVDDREQADADLAGAGVGHADGAFSQFDVPRVRLTLSGGALRRWLRYQLQFELSRLSGELGSRIKDAILEIRPTGRSFRWQVGQFKVPFGLQQLTSSGRQQFVDRAITDNKFVPGRDMGVMWAGSGAGRTIGYEVGVFNGAGESVRQTTKSPLWAGRVVFQPLGAYALSEGAVDGAEKPIVHVAFAARSGAQIRGRTPPGVFEHADHEGAYDVEFAIKTGRFYSTAEHFWMMDEQDNPVSGPDIDSRGYHAQAGWMLVPRHVEAALRVSAVQGDTAIDDASLVEWRVALGYFWSGHSLKVQGDVGQMRYGRNFAALSSRARAGLPALANRLVSGQAFADGQFRVQMQLAF
jgi:phosphate-selective porin